MERLLNEHAKRVGCKDSAVPSDASRPRRSHRDTCAFLLPPSASLVVICRDRMHCQRWMYHRPSWSLKSACREESVCKPLIPIIRYVTFCGGSILWYDYLLTLPLEVGLLQRARGQTDTHLIDRSSTFGGRRGRSSKQAFCSTDTETCSVSLSSWPRNSALSATIRKTCVRVPIPTPVPPSPHSRPLSHTSFVSRTIFIAPRSCCYRASLSDVRRFPRTLGGGDFEGQGQAQLS